MREEKASALPLLLDVRRMDENNRAYAYRMLRKNIMTLQLQPGCQLSEAELCEQLAMSRTPVHEALMMLKGEWLVDVLPQRGSIVSKISIPYLNEGFAMRRILEPALLRGLAGKLTPVQLDEFRALLDRQNTDLYIDQDAADDFSSRWTTTSTGCCTTIPVMTVSGKPCTTSLPTWTACAIWTRPFAGKYRFGAERARADLCLSARRPAAAGGRGSAV